MPEKNNIPDRVRQPKKYEQLFEILWQQNDESVFSSKAELMLLAAGIGFKEGKRTSFSESLEPIRISTFDNLKFFYMLFNTIAVAETGDINILANEKLNERVIIFEEYACTGLEVINDLVINQPGKKLDNVISLIQSQYSENSAVSAEDILKGFDLNL